MDNKAKVKNINVKYYGLIAYVAAMICMLVSLYLVFEGGRMCVLCGDLREQYIPAIKSLCRDIMGGSSIFYSQEFGLGINTALFNAYYTYSPFNILYLLFYTADETLVTYGIIILKTGLAALCFQKYISVSHKAEGLEGVLLAVLYSMCSFQVIYNTTNIIWLDAAFILPIVFLCIDRLFSEGRWIGLIFAYAYAIASQFYMGYIIAISSVLYFIIKLVIYQKELEIGKIISRYIGAGLLSIILSSFAWLPALVFLINNVSLSVSESTELGLNILDIYNQLFWGEVNNLGGAFPYIYCGILVIILTPLFFISRKTEKREKALWGIMIAILLISCLVSPVYMMWHGFDMPDSWGFRFSFIISFCLCVICAKCFDKIEDLSFSYLAKIFFVNICIYAIEIIFQTNKWGRQFPVNDWLGLGINAVFLIAWSGILFKGLTKDGSNKRLACLVAAVLIVIEGCSNAYCLFNKNSELISTLTSDGYYKWKQFSQAALDEIDDDNGFYRVNYLRSVILNSSLLYGYRGASYFSSAENVQLRNELGKLGIYSSDRIMPGAGYTDATNMLLGIKYNLYGYEQNEKSGEFYTRVVENDKVLGLGFMVCGTFDDYVLEDYNAFENNNYLFSTMTGRELKLFEEIDDSILQYEANGLYYVFDDGVFRIGNDGDDDNNRFIRIIVPGEDDDVYAMVINGYSQHISEAFLLNNGDENAIFDYGSMSVSYLKPLTKGEGGQYLEIISIPGKTVQAEEFGGFLFYSFKNDICDEVYDCLKDNQWQLESVQDGYYKGTVASTEDKKLMFTSIPYEKGWTLKVDGRVQEITPLLNETLIGVELENPGIHEIEFSYSEMKEIKETLLEMR